MNEQELFDLRRQKVLTFGNPIDLTAFLDGLFIEQIRFPLVVGYEKFPISEWRVVELPPRTTDHELTVRNYLEGQRQFRDYWKSDKDAQELLGPNFLSIVQYPGLDEHREGGLIFEVHIGLTSSSRNRCLGAYGLYLHNQGNYYSTRTEVSESILSKIMRKHMGPK
jgi:hypothetical protein